MHLVYSGCYYTNGDTDANGDIILYTSSDITTPSFDDTNPSMYCLLKDYDTNPAVYEFSNAVTLAEYFG